MNEKLKSALATVGTVLALSAFVILSVTVRWFFVISLISYIGFVIVTLLYISFKDKFENASQKS